MTRRAVAGMRAGNAAVAAVGRCLSSPVAVARGTNRTDSGSVREAFMSILEW